MRRKRNNSGFTMAEMLIVVAIIAVLGGVTFIAVQSHQRSLAQLERNTIAKELFFAAQNHLTMAESQGYLGLTEDDYGTRSTAAEDADKEVYYLVSNGAPSLGSMLDLMLPFGAIDESVRSGGSYLIRYQPHPATVLDVFYCSRSGKPERFNHTIGDEYSTFLGYRNNLPGSDYVVGWYGGGEAVDTGIYLNTPEVEIINGEKLIVKVTDNNVLYPIPMPGDSNKNVKASLEIIISGEPVETKGGDGTVISSETAKAVIVLNNPDNTNFTRSNRVSVDETGSVYTIVLDDITTPTALNGDGMHFADLNQYATGDPSNIWFMTDPEATTNKKPVFRPGENITVEAVTFSNSMLTNIAYSGAQTANSLFADTVVESGATVTFDPTKVRIANFRHLENLDKKVSGLEVEVTTADQIVDLGKLPEAGDGGSDGEEDEDDEESEEDTDLTSTGAGTTPAAEKDLSWTGFKQAINPTTPENVQVYIRSEKPQTVQDGTAKGCYYPISPDYALIYNGNGHSITDVVVAEAVDAGLFGAPTGKLVVKDLILVDFNISGSGNAGVLAGTLTGESEADNVLAYYSDILLDDATVTGTGADSPSKTMKVSSTGGNAGGLIGSMTGGSVTGSAAALIVSSEAATGANAGGLIGSAANVAVTDSYAGGHTTNGKYKTDAITDFNVAAASGNAGGLIGAASGTTDIRFSYATCSASGTVAGGLIGAADGNEVAVLHSYAVGRAAGTDAQGTLLGGGQIKVQALNESGSATTVSKTKADLDFVYAVDLDSEDLLMPKTIPTGAAVWKVRSDANPYDGALANAPVSRKYPFPTVNQLHQLNNESSYDPNAKSDFLSTHYGDWEEIKLLADADLALINAERLSAKITLPRDQIADGGVVTMLIRGESSHPIVDATNDAYDKTKDAYLVLMVTKPASEGGEYTLSLSPDSVVPGVTAENLQTWFSKLKKAGVGVKVPASNDATQTNAEIELNLDDITKEDGHFAQLFKTFIPGENISVAVKGGVVASDKLNAMVNAVMAHETLNSITKTVTTEVEGSSQSKTVTVAARTNSLFADPKRGTIVDGTDVTAATAMTASAAIANFRHLENLDAGISSREARLDNTVTGGNSITFTKAYQIRSLVGENITNEEATDGLNWMGFLSKISGVAVDNLKTDELDNAKMIKVYKIDNTTGGHICFIPVNPGAIAYDGQGHSIARVYVNTAENAGLFGTLPSGCTVSNLELIDFDIKSTGEAATAGALAGVNSGATITNVLAFNENHDKMTATVTAVGSAGGLVGSMTGGSVTQSAAALVVSSSGSGGGNAGGLIGTVTGTVTDTVTISGSYSGGHTSGGAYSTNNVAATSGNAGGLIGNAGPATVTNCYSTCSAKGATAGGLVGTASGTFTNCYATGLVQGTTETSTVGAFAGSIGSASGCLYFEAVNPGMAALGSGNDDNITELDADLATYKAFVATPWTDAKPYDKKLKDDYADDTNDDKFLYNLKGMTRLDTSTPATNFVATHYGDWPMPGILVNNTKNGG